MSADDTPSRLAGFPAAVRAEFVQMGVIRTPITLAVMLAVACLVFRIPGMGFDVMHAGAGAPPLLASYPLILCACAAWGSLVWSQLRPDERWYAYALPVRHTTFLFARVMAGALWLMLLLALAFGVSLAVDGAQFVSVRWLLLIGVTGGAIAFGLVTALAMLVRTPIYVALALLAVPLASGRLLRLKELTSVADYADQFILAPHGLFGALVGMSVQPVNGQFDVSPTEAWPVAAALWLLLTLLGLFAAARVMSRR